MAVIFSYELDRLGSGNELFDTDIPVFLKDDRLAWVHLDLNEDSVADWLKTNVNYLGDALISALLAEETRPRVSIHDDGMLVILREINHNFGANPEDMVSIRLWIDANRIISVQKRNAKSINDLVDFIKAGNAPSSSEMFIDFLLNQLLSSTTSELEARTIAVDEIEDEIFETGDVKPLEKISVQRRKNIILQRFLRPQKDVVHQIFRSGISWIEGDNRASIFETYQGYLRLSEELELNTERLRVAGDELAKQVQERLNSNLYRISLLSAIFLPLGFLTGLLGVNIGGIPGVEYDVAFTIFCVLLVIIIAIQIFILRKIKWI